MTAVVMGVDSSTQSCTVELRELETGRLVATGRAAHPPTHPPVSEQDPQAWWDALVEATHQALAIAGQVEVVGVAVGAQCHGLVASDASEKVIRPAKLWNDTTSATQAAALIEQYGKQWWADEIGLVPSAALTITKLAWLRDNEPLSFERVRHLALPHDWLTFRLTGRHVTDRSDASGTGFYSADQGKWRLDILSETIGAGDWSGALPTVLGPDQVAGTVAEVAAAALGIKAGAAVGPGGGDQHLAAIGIGLREGDVAYSLGTSGVVFATTDQAIHDPSGAIDGVANTTGGFLPLACTFNAAKVTDAMARLLAVSHDELSALALAASTDGARPVMAAYLDGERSPRLPWARGMISGLTSEVSREQMALAAYEGVVFGLVRGERRIAEYGVDIPGAAILVGGGAKSQAYRQIIADASGRVAQTVDAPEGTARGAAIQAAAVATGERVADVASAWQPPVTSETSPRQDRADEAYDRYLRLADAQADGGTF